MSIASSLCAESVNRTGAKVIEKMKKLKNDPHFYEPVGNEAIDKCIELVKEHFTEWTE